MMPIEHGAATKRAPKVINGCPPRPVPAPKPPQSGALTTAHALIAFVTISSVDIAHFRAASAQLPHYRSASSPISSQLRNMASREVPRLDLVKSAGSLGPSNLDLRILRKITATF